MTFPQRSLRAIALRCDAGRSIGVGHVVRCIALGQELRDRGCDVVLWGDLGGIDWLHELLAASRLRHLPAPAEVDRSLEYADREQFDPIVLDGYDLPVELGMSLRACGRTVLAMVDGAFGAAQAADVYVDQNLGATPHAGGPAGSVALTGCEFTLLRDSVLRRRRTIDMAHPRHIRSVLTVFGGSDPRDAAGHVIPSLLATGVPLDVTAVAADPSPVDRIAALPRSANQRLRVIPPQPDLAALAADADLVISASGSTVWELLAIGVPTAVVCVVDNQRMGYQAVLDEGVATGLGFLQEYDAARTTRVLRDLIENPSHATELAIRGQQLIDGMGRSRVADELLRAMAARPVIPR